MKLRRLNIILVTAFIMINNLFCNVNVHAQEILDSIVVESQENILREQYRQNIETYGDKYRDILISEILGFDINNIEKADKEGWYFYNNKLNDKQKKIYEKVLTSIAKQQQCRFSLDDVEMDEIWKFLHCIDYDHETLFWIDWYKQGTLQVDGNSNEYIFQSNSFEQFKTLEDIYLAWNKIKIYKENILDDTEQLSKTQVEQKIYNYIVLNTKFNRDLKYEGQSLWSVVQGESVCAGYAKMFKHLCDETDIQCICIYGTTDNGLHLWNIVNLDGLVYMIDCSWAATSYELNEEYINIGFNKTLDYMNKFYTMDDYYTIY